MLRRARHGLVPWAVVVRARVVRWRIRVARPSRYSWVCTASPTPPSRCARHIMATLGPRARLRTSFFLARGARGDPARFHPHGGTGGRGVPLRARRVASRAVRDVAVPARGRCGRGRPHDVRDRPARSGARQALERHARGCRTRWGSTRLRVAGVRPEKLRVVPEAVDIDRFDADAVAASPASSTSRRGRGACFDALRGGGVRSTKFLSVFKWEGAQGARGARTRTWTRSPRRTTSRCSCGATCTTMRPPKPERRRPVSARIAGFAEARREKGATRKASPRVYALPGFPRRRCSAYAAADAFVLLARRGLGPPARRGDEPRSAGDRHELVGAGQLLMTRENAYPAAVQDEPAALPEDSHWKTHRWAQPSEHHLRSLLKTHASPEEAPGKASGPRRTCVGDSRRRRWRAADARHVERLAREWRERAPPRGARTVTRR